MQIISEVTVGKVQATLAILLSGDERPYTEVPELVLIHDQLTAFLTLVSDHGQVMVLDDEQGDFRPVSALIDVVISATPDQAELVTWSGEELPGLMDYGSFTVYAGPNGDALVAALSVAGSSLSSASTVYIVLG